MRELILVAAGGLAREVLSVVDAANSHRMLGFLDDNPDIWGSRVAGHPVLGGIAQVKDHPDAEIVVCAGRGTSRRHLVDRLTGFGCHEDRYTRVVHPGVHVPSSCSIGRGSIVLANVALTADVHVGDHVVIMPNATLTHDDVVEDYATLCAGVTLGGNVTVREGAYLGMNASVREGTRVGPGSTLGMGSVLLTDLPAGATWAGVPARDITSRRRVGDA